MFGNDRLCRTLEHLTNRSAEGTVAKCWTPRPGSKPGASILANRLWWSCACGNLPSGSLPKKELPVYCS